MEIETSPGMYSTREDNSYSINFAIDTINRAYLGCTGTYLDVAGHMLAFYGKKTNPRAGLLHDQGVVASKAIADISSWMGYPAKWRVQCVSVSEASEILAGCKRLEKENWRRARWDLQNRLSSMQLNSTLSAAARPFQPLATTPLALVDNIPRDYPAQNGLARGSPTMGITAGSPVGRACLNHCYSSDEKGVSTDTTTSRKSLRKRCGGRGNRGNQSGSDSDETPTPRGRQKKKDGFSSKIQIPEFGGKKGHPLNVASAFRQWAHCITYYYEYYEDSYLMPLVVSSLTGDTLGMFDWMHSVTPGGAQDLSMLLQMLREHYCSSFMFREQRNMVENLPQGACEDATDFMIRVGSSIGNLAKDWKGQLTEAELQSLQYEVSLNGVREEIRHVLDSEIARHGKLTPHQMYEAVKRYETYVSHNKCLEGKSASPHIGHQRAVAQTSGYRPRFHKTTAFAASWMKNPSSILPLHWTALVCMSVKVCLFGLCNAPPTFQRLMQNCLGELNLSYCLIYLDDVIVFSEMPEEHLQRMRVVFDHLQEHGLKLKLSKCDVFKPEINYLARKGFFHRRRTWNPLLSVCLQTLTPK